MSQQNSTTLQRGVLSRLWVYLCDILCMRIWTRRSNHTHTSWPSRAERARIETEFVCVSSSLRVIQCFLKSANNFAPTICIIFLADFCRSWRPKKMVVCYVCIENGASSVCACTNAGLHDKCAQDLFDRDIYTCSVCKQRLRIPQRHLTRYACQCFCKFRILRILCTVAWIISCVCLFSIFLMTMMSISYPYKFVVGSFASALASSVGVVVSYRTRLVCSEWYYTRWFSFFR